MIMLHMNTARTSCGGKNVEGGHPCGGDEGMVKENACSSGDVNMTKRKEKKNIEEKLCDDQRGGIVNNSCNLYCEDGDAVLSPREHDDAMEGIDDGNVFMDDHVDDVVDGRCSKIRDPEPRVFTFDFPTNRGRTGTYDVNTSYDRGRTGTYDVNSSSGSDYFPGSNDTFIIDDENSPTTSSLVDDTKEGDDLEGHVDHGETKTDHDVLLQGEMNVLVEKIHSLMFSLKQSDIQSGDSCPDEVSFSLPQSSGGSRAQITSGYIQNFDPEEF